MKAADKKVNKGAVVEFFSAKDYLGPDPQGFPRTNRQQLDKGIKGSHENNAFLAPLVRLPD